MLKNRNHRCRKSTISLSVELLAKRAEYTRSQDGLLLFEQEKEEDACRRPELRVSLFIFQFQAEQELLVVCQFFHFDRI